MLKIVQWSAMFGVLALTGCESMSVSECKVADWSRVGFTDGASGAPESRLADYTDDCGKTGVVPHARAYRQGWDNGIQRYCTAANGWREGIQGRNGKESACQGQPGYRGFARYFEGGLRVYRTQEQIRRNTSEINRLEKELANAVKDDDKKRLRESLRDIDRSQSRLRSALAEQQQMAP